MENSTISIIDVLYYNYGSAELNFRSGSLFIDELIEMHMPKIFLSHSTKDNDMTRTISDSLKQAGFEVWVDFESIRDGSRWLHEIQSGIDACDGVVVVLSKPARQSEWVEKECLYTFGLKKPLFIALIEDVPLPLHLVNLQFTDCRQMEHGMAELVTALNHRLNSSSPPKYVDEETTAIPTEDNFFSYMEQLPLGETTMSIAKDLFDWVQYVADDIEFGGKYNPAYHVKINLNGSQVTIFSIWAYPKTPSMQIPLDYIGAYPPYTRVARRKSTLKKLSKLMPDGKQFDEDKVDRRPTMPLHYLSETEKLEDFKQIIVEIINRLRAE